MNFSTGTSSTPPPPGEEGEEAGGVGKCPPDVGCPDEVEDAVEELDEKGEEPCPGTSYDDEEIVRLFDDLEVC